MREPIRAETRQRLSEAVCGACQRLGMCPSSTAPVSGWASSRAYNGSSASVIALLGAAPRQRSTYGARACKSTSVGRGRPPTPASAILKGGPASIRRCNVLGRIIKRQRVIVVYPNPLRCHQYAAKPCPRADDQPSVERPPFGSSRVSRTAPRDHDRHRVERYTRRLMLGTHQST